jgi:hypothetical protein
MDRTGIAASLSRHEKMCSTGSLSCRSGSGSATDPSASTHRRLEVTADGDTGLRIQASGCLVGRFGLNRRNPGAVEGNLSRDCGSPDYLTPLDLKALILGYLALKCSIAGLFDFDHHSV